MKQIYTMVSISYDPRAYRSQIIQGNVLVESYNEAVGIMYAKTKELLPNNTDITVQGIALDQKILLNGYVELSTSKP